MKPVVTVSYGGLSAAGRLDGWTGAALSRLSDRALAAAEADGAPLRLVRRAGGGLALVDPAADAFAREYGTRSHPAAPRLGPLADRLLTGGV